MAQNIEPRKNSHIEGELLCMSLPEIEIMADLSEPLAKFPYLRRYMGDSATLGFLSCQSQFLVPLSAKSHEPPCQIFLHHHPSC